MKRIVLIWVAMTVITPGSARSDVTFSCEMNLRAIGLNMSRDITTIMIKGERARFSEQEILGLPSLASDTRKSQKVASLIHLDTEKKWVLFSDSTFVEEPLSEEYESGISLVNDMQSLDSSFRSSRNPIIWLIDSIVQAKVTVLTMPGRMIASYASGSSTRLGEGMYVDCSFGLVLEQDLDIEIAKTNKRFDQVTEFSAIFRFELYDKLLANFGTSLKDLALDTLSGIPMRVNFSITADIPDGAAEKIDVDELADKTVFEEILLEKAAIENQNSDPANVDFHEVDSLVDEYAALFMRLKNNLKPGRMELFGFSMEITDIDTTSLPDSLFEIPEGYTEQ